MNVIQRVWHYPLSGANPFLCLDWLLQNIARCLQSWSARFVGSVHIQLEVAKEVLHKLEVARDGRALTSHEEWLRQLVKLKLLVIASL
jgi:hypothetical protein